MAGNPDQRARPEVVELAAELDEAIDAGEPEEIERLGTELHDLDPQAGASSSD